MPEFTIKREIAAPVTEVWSVLDDFGDIQRWNPGVVASRLTSTGPVAAGATRTCEFTPFGSVNERIDEYWTNERMTVAIFETSRLPISEAVADFNLTPTETGTQLTLHYSYTLNLLGKLMRGYTRKQLEKGLGGLAKSLQMESERLNTSG